MLEMLDKLAMKKPPIVSTDRRKNVGWAQLTLIAKIEHRIWTNDGKLRHASCKGVRARQSGRLRNGGVIFSRVLQRSDAQRAPVC